MYAEDAWRDKIAVWLSVRRFEYVLGSDVLTNCLEIPIERQDYRALTRVNRVLRSLGYYKTRKDLSGEFKTIWRKSV
jgi:putative DNA primase/helicase